MTTVMTRKSRERAIRELHAIWDGRDVPHIPDADLNRMTDADIAFLLRFWAHKNLWWNTQNAPAFNAEPPMGYAKMFAGTVLIPAKPVKPPKAVETTTRNFGRTFKSTNGGHLTARQQTKAQKTTASG